MTARKKEAADADTAEAPENTTSNATDINAARSFCKLTVFPSGYETQGRVIEADVAMMTALLARTVTTKENQRLIKLGKLKDDSRAAEDKAKGIPPSQVTAFTGLELDFDNAGSTSYATNQEVARSLGLFAFFHETVSNKEKPGSYRILLPFAEPKNELEREWLFRAAKRIFEGVSKETKDPKRCYFIGRLKGQSPRSDLLDGPNRLDELPSAPQDKPLVEAAKSGDDRYNALKDYITRQWQAGIHDEATLRDRLEEQAETLYPGYLAAGKAKGLYRYIKWCAAKSKAETTETDEDEDDFLIYVASEYQFEEPTPQPYIGDGWLPENVPSMLVGPGGGGKGWFALQLAVCASLGLDFMGRRTKQVKTLFVSTEDDRDQLHRRLHGMLQKLAVPKSDLDFLIADWTGIDPTLFLANDAIGAATSRYAELRQACVEREVELLILDNAAQLFAGNENDRRSVTAFSRSTAQLAPTTLMLGHVNKLSVETGGHAAGSTAWENARRSVFGIFGKAGEQRQFKVIKSNYTEPGLQAPITWDSDYGFLDFGTLSSPSLATDGANLVLKRMAELQLANTRIFRAASGGATNIKTSLKLDGYSATQLDKLARKLEKNGFIVETLQQRAQTWRVTETGFAFVETLPKF